MGRLFIPLKLEERIGNTHEIIKICLNFARKYRADTLHETNTFIASKNYLWHENNNSKVRGGTQKIFSTDSSGQKGGSMEEKKEETV